LLSTIIAAAVILGALIFVHELGHFAAAKLFGVGVRRFSLGFGPRLLARQVGETEYCLSAVPLGGYVRMVGDVPGEELDPAEAPRSFTTKSLGRRFAIVLAGPLFNLLFALVVFCLVFAVHGLPVLSPEVGEVKAGFPAAQAGLRKGDVVVAIGGRQVERWEQLAEVIRANPGRAIPVSVERGGKLIRVSVTPEIREVENIFGEKEAVPVIGVSAAGRVSVRKVGPLEAVGYAAAQTYAVIEITVLGIIKLIERVVPAKSLGGPILILQIAGQTAQRGLLSVLFFAASLSINLGVINLLPIPVLDGGHLLFFGFEGVMGRPVSMRKREVAQQVGLFVLILLIIFVFYNDISRIVVG
jgi:regulator of sigma E protease